MSTSAFFSSDCIVNHSVEENKEILKLESLAEISLFFELERCIIWIKENGFERVALQLPDAFLSFSYDIALLLEKETLAKIYILADTSYKNCCIDEIAADHAKCDSLIHYGEACLSKPSSRIPILYVFGRQPVDIDHFSISLKSLLEQEELERGTEFVLLYDANIASCSSDICDACRKLVPFNPFFEAKVIVNPNIGTSEEEIHLGRQVPNNIDKAECPILIFVGSENSPLIVLWLMTYIRFETVFSYSPQTKSICKYKPSTIRNLKKRLFLIEQVRDANTIGLVVATTGVKGYHEAISRIRQLCKNNQRRLYVLSIGKINEAKLSNFASDIDVFVLLSCPFGIILDSNAFFKPVVSLFEAEIALNPAKTWFAEKGWTAEFLDFIHNPIDQRNKDEIDMSLVSGRIRSVKIETNNLPDKDKQVIEYTAGDYFNNRTWKGLDDQPREDDLTLMPGRKGTSISYEYQ